MAEDIIKKIDVCGQKFGSRAETETHRRKAYPNAALPKKKSNSKYI
jgi:hypothetical protein